jgi:hypothetical protein
LVEEEKKKPLPNFLPFTKLQNLQSFTKVVKKKKKSASQVHFCLLNLSRFSKEKEQVVFCRHFIHQSSFKKQVFFLKVAILKNIKEQKKL